MNGQNRVSLCVELDGASTFTGDELIEVVPKADYDSLVSVYNVARETVRKQAFDIDARWEPTVKNLRAEIEQRKQWLGERDERCGELIGDLAKAQEHIKELEAQLDAMAERL
jgi:transposase